MRKSTYLLLGAGAFGLAFLGCSIYDYFALYRAGGESMLVYLAVRAAEFLIPGVILLIMGLVRRAGEKNG